MSIRRFALAALASALIAGPVAAAETLLNVSYDPTRELYQEYNAEFVNFWKKEHAGDTVSIKQSHGGSGKQGRAVAWSYARNWRRLAQDPAHAVGMLVLRALEAGAYVWGARRGRRDRSG